MIITYKFEVLGYAGLCWPSLAFLAFVALDDFLKQKLAFVDKIQAQLACFQQSDVKTNYQTRSGILNHCDKYGYYSKAVHNHTPFPDSLQHTIY